MKRCPRDPMYFWVPHPHSPPCIQQPGNSSKIKLCFCNNYSLWPLIPTVWSLPLFHLAFPGISPFSATMEEHPHPKSSLWITSGICQRDSLWGENSLLSPVIYYFPIIVRKHPQLKREGFKGFIVCYDWSPMEFMVAGLWLWGSLQTLSPGVREGPRTRDGALPKAYPHWPCSVI